MTCSDLAQRLTDVINKAATMKFNAMVHILLRARARTL